MILRLTATDGYGSTVWMIVGLVLGALLVVCVVIVVVYRSSLRRKSLKAGAAQPSSENLLHAGPTELEWDDPIVVSAAAYDAPLPELPAHDPSETSTDEMHDNPVYCAAAPGSIERVPYKAGSDGDTPVYDVARHIKDDDCLV